MSTTYIEKLESNFHPRFITMKVNQESKRWNIISYVRMLEEMCKDRGIEIEREPFHITNNFVYIQDQNGEKKCWCIYDETNHGTYKVAYYDLITEIYKSKIYRDSDERLCYSECVCVPENVNQFSLSYIVDMFIDSITDVEESEV
jgi:hypothetical protein